MLAEVDYDLSVHANKGESVTNIKFVKSKNAAKYSNIELKVSINIFNPSINQPLLTTATQ